MGQAVIVPIVGWITAVIGTSQIAVAIATIAAYAVVGAAVGALTSLVVGGDIGQGALYGAIGGAVMGGFTIATNANYISAMQSGADAMHANGYSAGMTAFENGLNAPPTTGGKVPATNSTTPTVEGGVGPNATNNLADKTGPLADQSGNITVNLAKDGMNSSWGSIAAGAANAYMTNKNAEDARKQSQEQFQTQLATTVAENEKNRQHEAAMLAQQQSGSTTVREAIIAAQSAEKRQREQQEHERQMRILERDFQVADNKAYNEGVTKASKVFKGQVGQVGSFLNTPGWLGTPTQTVASTAGSVQDQATGQIIPATAG